MLDFLYTLSDILTVFGTPSHIAAEGYDFLSSAVDAIIDVTYILFGWIDGLAELLTLIP